LKFNLTFIKKLIGYENSKEEFDLNEALGMIDE
jgi:hypothetical protein